MAHLRHVRLLPHKGLKDATLLELGKINVVCGPNNSGKTTILECIARAKYYVGLDVDQNVAHSIANGGRNGTGWGTGNDHIDRQYINAVKGALSRQKVWFSNQYEELKAGIDWRFAANWGNPQGQLPHVFGNSFPKEPVSVLIPAKRRLETAKHYEAYNDIRPDGTGVLNALLTAKNKPASATDKVTFNLICAAFEKISAGYEFDVFIQERNHLQSPPNTAAQLHFCRKGSSWIQADDCGLGLQELLILLYFTIASGEEVILIEEPENHLHPEIQRRLLSFLHGKTKKQFFLSTHSSVFLNTQYADRVFTCRMTDSVHIDDSTSRASKLAELGYSIADNLVSDLVVLCEGPKDKPVLEEFLKKMGLSDKCNIKIWPLGGDIMDQLDLSVFQESHKLIALIDNDPGSSKIRQRFEKKCKDGQIPVTKLTRYSLENYFSLAAIASVMKGQMPSGITKMEPNKRVSDQLGFEVKSNGGKIAKEMKLEDIKGTDLDEFLNQVQSLATKAQKA